MEFPLALFKNICFSLEILQLIVFYLSVLNYSVNSVSDNSKFPASIVYCSFGFMALHSHVLGYL